VAAHAPLRRQVIVWAFARRVYGQIVLQSCLLTFKKAFYQIKTFIPCYKKNSRAIDLN